MELCTQIVVRKHGTIGKLVLHICLYYHKEEVLGQRRVLELCRSLHSELTVTQIQFTSIDCIWPIYCIQFIYFLYRLPLPVY